MEPNTIEVEFRDGARIIPRYLAQMMTGLETFRLTYQEAVERANQQIVRDRLNSAQQGLISGTFRGRGF